MLCWLYQLILLCVNESIVFISEFHCVLHNDSKVLSYLKRPCVTAADYDMTVSGDICQVCKSEFFCKKKKKKPSTDVMLFQMYCSTDSWLKRDFVFFFFFCLIVLNCETVKTEQWYDHHHSGLTALYWCQQQFIFTPRRSQPDPCHWCAACCLVPHHSACARPALPAHWEWDTHWWGLHIHTWWSLMTKPRGYSHILIFWKL